MAVEAAAHTANYYANQHSKKYNDNLIKKRENIARKLKNGTLLNSNENTKKIKTEIINFQECDQLQ